MEISGYKSAQQSSANSFHCKYKNPDIGCNTINFIEEFQEIYSLFRVNIEQFCRRTNEFAKRIAEVQSFYFPKDEKSWEIVRFMNFMLTDAAPYEALNAALSLVHAMFSFNTDVGLCFLETQLIENVVELLHRTKPKNYEVIRRSLEILSSAIACSEKCNAEEYSRNCTLRRIFNNISLEDLKAKSFANEKSGLALLLLLYSVVKMDVDSDFQNQILDILEEIYESEKEKFYFHTSWILSRLTGFEKTFPFDVFIQSNLPNFLIDALNFSECTYPVLESIENIYNNWNPKNAFKDCFDKILHIAFDEDVKMGLKQAAFSVINTFLKKDFDFFTYFNDNCLWRQCIECYNNVTFEIKPKITHALLTYQQNCDFLSLQKMVEYGYISLLNDSIEIDLQGLGKPAIIGLRYLIEAFTRNQYGGFIEMKAVNELNIDKLDEIIDHPDNRDISKDAIILQSLLVNLPNGFLKRQKN